MKTLLGLASIAALAIAAPAGARTVVDEQGDFLPGYTGPRLNDLDVITFSVNYDSVASQFLLAASFAGTIDPATAGLYVIGVNTGAGAIAPFASIGQGNVRFDQAIVIRKDGTGNIGQTVLSPSLIAIAGNTFSARIDAGLLPSTGLAPSRYGFNLWPRVGFGDNSQISDFAPENALLSAVPEPATWAMMILGFGAVAGALRIRRRAVPTVA